jgi:dipeptidyl aminopeptidase/acylaminoacyl peptidase
MRAIAKKFLTVGIALGAAFTAVQTVPSAAQNNQQGTIPVEVWSLRNIVNAVQVSPDGKHILVHKLESREGEYLMEIYSTDDLQKPLKRLNADPMEIINARWVSDNYIYGQAWQTVRKRVTGPEEDVRSYKSFSYSLKDEKFAEVEGNFSIVGTLPNEPTKVLIASGSEVSDATGVDPFAAFRPRSYYKFDLNRGTRSLIVKGSEKFPETDFDNMGNPRFRVALDRNTNEIQPYFRTADGDDWIKHPETFDQDDHDNLYQFLGGPWGLVGFKDGDPNTGYFLDRNGGDKAALYEFDFRTGQLGTKLYENPDADVMDIQLHSIPGNNKLVAAVYPGAKYERHWFDEEEKALYEALEAQIPHAHQVSISSRSRDGSTMIVTNRGPRDPGSFWLVKEGRMAKLGSRNPLVDPAKLSDVRYIRYQARDGLTIPAYVTIPEGEGPFPLVVQHNGGPHVNAVQGYAEMSQMLANAGYMVLYPQNRISTGWGKAHFDAGYGEHGLAMQNDKDDGAKYLVEQGLADPNRIAFFGWSYGGYAALVASSRQEQIYQCSIAVAAVADAEKTYKKRSNPETPKAIDDWAQRRGMIGVNPIDEVANTNIPLLMVHGDWDRRVLYFNFKDYKKAMEDAGQTTAQYLTLKGADHFSNTLMYEHQQALYTKMLDFLANDCGPGGL